MKRQKLFSTLFLVSVSIFSSLNAQMAGNPVTVRGEGEWTMSVFGTYLNQQLGSGTTTVSRRVLLKSTWGVTPWLDVYLTGGGTQLEVKVSQEGIESYKDKYRFGFGAGFTLNLVTLPQSGIGFWLGGQVMRFPSQGSFMELFDIETETIYREFVMKYDCREFQGCIGVTVPFRSVRFYAAGVGWAIQRLEKKKEYLEYGDSRTFVGDSEGEYRSGLWTGATLGMEILLPHRYSIGVECLLFNQRNYQIMVGICQTGVTNW